MKDETKYVQFPLFLMRNIHLDVTGTINQIICFGVYWLSKKINCSLIDVSRQIIFEIYRGELSEELEKIIYKIEWQFVGQDKYYNGFNGSSFDPVHEIEEYVQVLEANQLLKEKSIEHYQMHQALSRLQLNGYIPTYILVGKEIEKQMPVKEPMPMISIDLLNEFKRIPKSEFQIMQFAAYVAVKSIIGPNRACVRTNKQLIINRMFGYSSCKHLPPIMNPISIDLYKKYSKRYHIDQIIDQLQLNWKILSYSNQMRGMYIALGWKISIRALVLLAEKNRLSNRLSEIKKTKAEAKIAALRQLNK